MAGLKVLSDAPVGTLGDLLAFRRYREPLVAILTNENAQTPFTVGIFGPWGGGKSSLLRMINEELEIHHPDAFVRVYFNPWLYREESNLLIPLLHTLNDNLNEDRRQRFGEAAKKVGKVLLYLGTDILLKKITADTLSIDQLKTAKETLDKERGDVESEIRKLKATLQSVADEINQKGARLVLFIDDLDRCEPDAIIDLLEAVKLFFDLEHTFIFLAIDKEVIDRGIEVKYSKFPFADGREKVIGAEYLEKMVQLPLQLFPLHKSQVRKFITDLEPAELVIDNLELLEAIVLPNPRKIKRILNILTVTDAIVRSSEVLAGLQADLLVRLIVLQVQGNELYSQVIQLPETLIALESVYKGSIRPDKLEDFVEFGKYAQSLQKTCQDYYLPGSYLETLFAGATFRDNKSDLHTYLTLLGG